MDRAAFLKQATGLFALAALDRSVLRPRAIDPLHHPEPRPGITAEHVLADTELGESKKVLAAYAAARANPEIFDGLACACGCSEHGGEHRSLLVCYETRQPTGCQGCQDLARFVGEQAKAGAKLPEIRTAYDKKFGH
jgi:hypothetical protein